MMTPRALRRHDHDFMMLGLLRSSAASTAAIEQAIHVLRKAFAQR